MLEHHPCFWMTSKLALEITVLLVLETPAFHKLPTCPSATSSALFQSVLTEWGFYQDKFDHDKGQKSAISGRRLHWRLSTGFLPFLQYLCAN